MRSARKSLSPDNKGFLSSEFPPISPSSSIISIDPMTWKDVRDAKLTERDRKLAPYIVADLPADNDISGFFDRSQALTPRQLELTDLDIPELLRAYEEGKYTCYEAVDAYCRRATVAHQLTNCLTEIRFEEALEEARQLDSYFQAHGKLKGPLHGVVVSLKDNIHVAGLSSSMGFVGLANDVQLEDSAFAKLIKSLGGIILCKTNTSAGMAYSETTNVLWGRTLNPFSRIYLNVGGSSGGEGALALLRGSCFGVGSDIGGSVRHPAALNMVYSLKPSSGRFPKYGSHSGQQGQESIVSIYGLLTRSIENLNYVASALIDSEPWRFDASCLPLQYRPYERKKLKIGIMRSDGLNCVTPPVQRALNTVKKALENEGHTLVEWEDTYFREIRSTIYPFYSADGMKHIKSILAKLDEPPDNHLSFDGARDMSVSELWRSQSERSYYAQKYWELWNSHELDAVISACSPYPACLRNRIVPQPLNSIWNALDYTAGTFPATRCTAEDVPLERTDFISEADKQTHQTYAAEFDKFVGGPVSLQVVCRRLEEEKCLLLLRHFSAIYQAEVKRGSG